MATITFERNQNTVGSPTWVDIAANTLVFSGSLTDLTTTIDTADWQDGTHIGTGDPGSDACGGGPASGHMNNVRFVNSTNFILNGGTSEVLNDTNLIAGECTLRLHLNSVSSVSTQNSFFFNFDGITDTTPAVGIETYVFEQGEAKTAWEQINDDSVSVGGDNAGERLDIAESVAAATDHYWYLALSSRGETAGGKTSHDFKMRTETF
ncbi:hypothetical protein LCGC14_0442480 [marine sediment metagenome]|uniref:Uncharacterized protein n=1 Tax=marine sediment metagenome TaxID=412755 RepID=A0A0F9VU16_9ZZZZ